jgi:hypothetical protein
MHLFHDALTGRGPYARGQVVFEFLDFVALPSLCVTQSLWRFAESFPRRKQQRVQQGARGCNEVRLLVICCSTEYSNLNLKVSNPFISLLHLLPLRFE